MSPASAKPVDELPRRMVFICTTLGLHPTALWPATPGVDYEATEYLSLLEEHRSDFTLFSGLCHEGQAGRRPHDDQVAASQIGGVTRFPSLTLASNNLLSQSYTNSGVMIPARTSPAKLFADLFLEGSAAEIKLQKQRLQDGQSILDQLGSQAKQLGRATSVHDNSLLSEYFDAVRGAEKDITAAQSWLERPKPAVADQQPQDIRNKKDIVGRMQLLMNLIPLIVQTDSSRVVSVMIQDHFVTPEIEGVVGNHHNLSHHGQDPTKIAQLKKIETKLLGCYGSLLSQMKSKLESGRPLLENTSILFGSNLGNANSHNTRNLPIVLAGGSFRHGQFISYVEPTPLSNLFVAMLNRTGVETESFGQSTGALSWQDN